MTQTSTGSTPTDLIAAATETLLAGGYRQVQTNAPDWSTSSSRLFEDEYNVVGVTVYDTCSELLRKWPDAQGSLVDLISSHVGRSEAKSWDGYLVLLTPGFAPSEGAETEALQANTTRLRKIVATGDELQTPSDVERVLRPLLPLANEQARLSHESALELLPTLLARQDISEKTTKLLVAAFKEQAPLLERLHELRGEK